MNTAAEIETMKCLHCQTPMAIGENLVMSAGGVHLRDRMCSNECVVGYFRTISNFKPGDGATISIGSDSYPATITRVTAHQITAQYDRPRGKNLFTLDPNAETHTFRLSRHGAWKHGNYRLHPGERFYDLDPSF